MQKRTGMIGYFLSLAGFFCGWLAGWTFADGNVKYIVQYSEQQAMAMGGRVPEGGYRLTYSQEFSLVVFIFLVTVFAGAAGMLAVGKLDKKLRRCLTHRLGKLGKDQRWWAALYYVVYGAVTLALWITMLSGVFCLQQLLEVAIWG